jgi:hypothetical protein
MDEMQTVNPEAEILERVIAPGERVLSRSAAEVLSALAFPQADIDRMNHLAEKNRAGEAAPEEAAEMERYSRVGNLINLLQLKARRSLADG